MGRIPLTRAHIRIYSTVVLVAGIALIVIASLNIRIRTLYHPKSLRPNDVVCSYIPSYNDIVNTGDVTMNSDGTVIFDSPDLRNLERKEVRTSIFAFALMIVALTTGILLSTASIVVLYYA